jgi:N-acetylneuraminic acid mutarotase
MLAAAGQLGGGAGGGGANGGGGAGGVNLGGGGGNPTSENGGGGADAGGAAGGTQVETGIALLPADRQEHGVVAAHGEIFVLGGYAPNVTASVLAYDVNADSWRDVADFPSPFNHPAAGVVGDKIYVAGFYAGTSLTGPATGQTFVYDPVADSWQERKALPAGTERAGGCVAVLGTDLYVFGGGNSGEATSFASVYDTVRDTWTELPPLPETREHCAAFASGGKLYIAGGRTHTIPEFRPTTLEYEPGALTYQQKKPIPTPRGGAAGAVLAGRLFLFGGEGADNEPGVFSDIEAYDATSDSWEAFAPLLIPRHGFGAATLGERVYLPGGATRQGGAASDINTVFYFESP